MNISTIMILAAGLGKRLRPYTSNTPKSLIKVGKYTLIEKIINEIEKNRFKKIIINLHYLDLRSFLLLLADDLMTSPSFGEHISIEAIGHFSFNGTSLILSADDGNDF